MRLRLVVALSILFIYGPALGARVGASWDTANTTNESKITCTDIEPNAKDLPLPGPACEKELFARRGRPFMFPTRDGIAVGVSYGLDKPAKLYLWFDNQTDKAKTFYVCCVSTLFENIDIFDSEGHRVLSTADNAEQKARSEGRETVQVCTCSGSLSLPPNTMRLVDSAYLTQQYTLQPGRYIISERNPPAPYNLTPDEHGGA
jgi:hypothetical protein